MPLETLVCPNCGGSVSQEIRRGKVFKCDHCGHTLVWPERQATRVLRSGDRLCPNCGSDNKSSRAFCRNCGAALTKSCPVCGISFYVGDNFCPRGHDYEIETRLQQEITRRELQRQKITEIGLAISTLEQRIQRLNSEKPEVFPKMGTCFGGMLALFGIAIPIVDLVSDSEISDGSSVIALLLIVGGVFLIVWIRSLCAEIGRRLDRKIAQARSEIAKLAKERAELAED